MSALFSLFSAIFAGPRFFQIQKLLEIYYHGNVTQTTSLLYTAQFVSEQLI